jgi:hypothetical protein
MDLFTSVSYEIELWNLFASSRGANATIFLATVIAVWVAARFSSVMVDKGANTVAKLIGTAFAISVFLIGLNLAGLINGTYEGHAMALNALDVANGDIDLGAGSQGWLASQAEGNMMSTLGGWIFYISGLLIAVLPLWLNPSD